MKLLRLKEPDKDHIKRRFDSGEFRVFVLFGAVIAAFSIDSMIAGAMANAALSSAYTLSRTLRKMSRTDLMHTSQESSEMQGLLSCAAYTVILACFGLNHAIVISALALPSSVFMVCRGILKKAERKLIMKQNLSPV